MKTIEEIKNEISKDLGHENFKELFENAVKNLPIEKAFLKINCIINEASLNYAKEVAIATLEKASNNLRQASGSFNYDFYSQKRSITDKENIIL